LRGAKIPHRATSSSNFSEFASDRMSQVVCPTNLATTFNVFAVRAEELIENRPELVAAVRPLLEARKAIERQVSDLDRKVLRLARHDAEVRRFMTAPGVGPITALCFKATIDDPTRFCVVSETGSGEVHG
jgi:hypothetical protein